MKNLEFIENANPQWKKHYSNQDVYPTVDSIVIKEKILIGKQGIYNLEIGKVLSINGLGYMAWIRSSGGSGCNSKVYKTYELCLEKGKEILIKEAVDFEEKLDKFLENQKLLKSKKDGNQRENFSFVDGE